MRLSRYNPRRGLVDPRPLHLKIRVTVTRRMPVTTVRELLDRAVETGHVPPGIVIHWIDWAKGTEGRVAEGRIPSEDVREALRRFYGAITSGTTRFDRVRQ